MRTRTAAFTLALCLASSFALADNPSDAPLVTDDAGSAVIQQGKRAGATDHHQNKKEVSASEKMVKNSSKSRQKRAKHASQAPAKTTARSAL